MAFSIGDAPPTRCAVGGVPVVAGSVREAALIVVAHGSRDPRSASTISTVMDEIASERSYLDVHLAFLDLCAPSVDQVIDTVAARGHRRAIVVPLLLGSAFHARVDLPALVDAARARHPRLRLIQADVLGPDPRLIAALRDRVVEFGQAESDGQSGVPEHRWDRRPRARVPSAVTALAATHLAATHLGAIDLAAMNPDVMDPGVIVAAVGSSSTAANARTAEVGRRLASMTGWATEICFATAEPTITEARARLRDRGRERIVVAPWFLAPGLLTDRLRRTEPDLPHAAVIGAHPALAAIVWDRYDAADAAIPLTA